MFLDPCAACWWMLVDSLGLGVFHKTPQGWGVSAEKRKGVGIFWQEKSGFLVFRVQLLGRFSFFTRGERQPPKMFFLGREIKS